MPQAITPGTFIAAFGQQLTQAIQVNPAAGAQQLGAVNALGQPAVNTSQLMQQVDTIIGQNVTTIDASLATVGIGSPLQLSATPQAVGVNGLLAGQQPRIGNAADVQRDTATGMPVQTFVDPNTGQAVQALVDPNTGAPMMQTMVDPTTGQAVQAVVVPTGVTPAATQAPMAQSAVQPNFVLNNQPTTVQSQPQAAQPNMMETLLRTMMELLNMMTGTGTV